MTLTLTPGVEARLRAVAMRRRLAPEAVIETLLAENDTTPEGEGDGAGAARVAGTRIKVADLALEHTRLGMSPTQIVEAHPHLTPAQVHMALAYYYEHQDEVEAQIEASLAFADQSRNKAAESPFAARLRAEGRLPSRDQAA